MIRLCPACSGMDIDELRKALLGEEFEEGCIGTCGTDLIGEINDELITADSQEDFIAKCK
ncbi:DUF1450 domain-containing protein [Romboutsia sp.]|uniref:DUF1450 domain-containing protein n=1 Tax=Romboutsia sp. TaxID=1965302 RepID=UPI003F3C9502